MIIDDQENIRLIRIWLIVTIVVYFIEDVVHFHEVVNFSNFFKIQSGCVAVQGVGVLMTFF